MKNRLLDAGLGYFPTERTKDRTSGSPGDDLPILDEAELNRLIKERAPWFAGKIGHVTWKTLVRFEKRQAESFGSGRMWLAGVQPTRRPRRHQSMNRGWWKPTTRQPHCRGPKQGSPFRWVLHFRSVASGRDSRSSHPRPPLHPASRAQLASASASAMITTLAEGRAHLQILARAPLS
jgi:hypothetical protein